MKKIIVLLLLLLSVQAMPQQGGSHAALLPGSGKHFGLYGIGNLNTESFNSVNSSGKLSGYVQLLRNNLTKSITVYLSVNRNATNNDSTLASTLLFPEIGRSSFIGTVNYIEKIKSLDHYWGLYGQGSFKTIRGQRRIQPSEKDTSLFFSILDWQAGIRYFNDVNPGEEKVIFSLSAFLNYYNIPDEDNSDYRFIFNNTGMPSSFWGLGVKVSLEVNRLQLYADIRHVFGSEKNIPSRDLRGHNLNVGVLFNADFFEK